MTTPASDRLRSPRLARPADDLVGHLPALEEFGRFAAFGHCGIVSDDHLAGMPMVQTAICSSPRWLAEAFLLCRTQDGVLVRGAAMGRESGGGRVPEYRRPPEWRWRSMHASPRGKLKLREPGTDTSIPSALRSADLALPIA